MEIIRESTINQQENFHNDNFLLRFDAFKPFHSMSTLYTDRCRKFESPLLFFKFYFTLNVGVIVVGHASLKGISLNNVTDVSHLVP